jgi:hypothetical protein
LQVDAGKEDCRIAMLAVPVDEITNAVEKVSESIK